MLFILLITTDLIFHKQSYKPTGWLAIAGFCCIFFLSLTQYPLSFQKSPGSFLGMIHSTQYTSLFKSIFQLMGILTILLAWIEKKTYAKSGEFFSILTALLLGLHLMIMGSHLMIVYLGIELVSISSYALTYFADNKRSTQGSLRYILFGAMSSGVMLYGISWLYGLTGSLVFLDTVFWETLATQPPLLVTIALILTLSGILFKIAVVPFHVWAPDIYDAAPLSVVTFFSIAPKLAALFILLVISQLDTIDKFGFQSFIAILSIASITIGNFSALAQSNSRKMMAYSSIAHSGFLLIGLLGRNTFSVETFLFYSITYLFINVSAFLLLLWLERITDSHTIHDYKGLGMNFPGLGIAIVIIMIALAGLPPTVGFTAKLLIFSSLWTIYTQSGNVLLLILFGWGLLNIAVSIFYYLRIPYYLFFKSGTTSYSPSIKSFHWTEIILLIAVMAPVLVLFFKSSWLTESLGLFLR
ncbi:NADH-quinone oxidoreductase subunit N [Cytophagaceae bacterium YF14B1]|uniref:NADH-quinone oxidoreductase subunit N n=1 Tax=Xanthocytophaga flava TaxID=3048013 RepID=A0AAE3U7B0_9BACT|nr:NADH-quinone oxidoreductase subunit N [Xanthocytophaga flavus]MDJ1482206.1 NADH-quinone oxidoreductase subunit N [Xanthocytophaga flavus]